MPAVVGGERGKPKWYHCWLTLVVAVLCLGPLALPLVWTNKKYSLTTKTTITIAVTGLTVWLCYIMMEMYIGLLDQFDVLTQ